MTELSKSQKNELNKKLRDAQFQAWKDHYLVDGNGLLAFLSTIYRAGRLSFFFTVFLSMTALAVICLTPVMANFSETFRGAYIDFHTYMATTPVDETIFWISSTAADIITTFMMWGFGIGLFIELEKVAGGKRRQAKQEYISRLIDENQRHGVI